MNPADFTAYSTGNLCNANPRVAALPSAIVPLIRGRRVAGRALTARIVPGHNAAVHRAVRRAQPGDLLVVDGAGETTFDIFNLGSVPSADPAGEVTP